MPGTGQGPNSLLFVAIIENVQCTDQSLGSQRLRWSVPCGTAFRGAMCVTYILNLCSHIPPTCKHTAVESCALHFFMFAYFFILLCYWEWVVGLGVCQIYL